jgi:ribosomal protein S11
MLYKKKNWILPEKIKKFRLEARLRSNRIWLDDGTDKLLPCIKLKSFDTSYLGIRVVRQKLPNPRFELQYQAYLRRLKAQENYFKLGIKNKARKDGKPLRVFMPQKYILSEPEIVRTGKIFTTDRASMKDFYKLKLTKPYLTPYKVSKSLVLYNLEHLKWPYYVRHTRMLWTRGERLFRFQRYHFFQKPAFWLRFIPKYNNCYALVVRPDKSYFSNRFKDFRSFKKFRKIITPLRFYKDYRKQFEFNEALLRRMKNRTKSFYKYLIKHTRKAGRVYTVKSAGVTSLKGPKRTSAAAAQELGFIMAKYLRSNRIRYIFVDSHVQYHYRQGPFLKGLLNTSIKAKVIAYRGVSKIPHSKGLRKRKQRRT